MREEFKIREVEGIPIAPHIIRVYYTDVEYFCLGYGIKKELLGRWVSWGWLPGRRINWIWVANRADFNSFLNEVRAHGIKSDFAMIRREWNGL